MALADNLADLAKEFEGNVANRSLSASGYQKLPGGLILQWGVCPTTASNAQQAITFPIPFPTACLCAVSSASSSTTSASVALNVATFNTTTLTLHNSSLQSAGGYWFAVGK